MGVLGELEEGRVNPRELVQEMGEMMSSDHLEAKAVMEAQHMEVRARIYC
jgi:hypothetical protein